MAFDHNSIAAFATPPHPLVKATADGYFAPVRLDPTGLAEWICHSKGSPFTSDESKLYIQSGWSWTNWRIRNNYLEVKYQYPAVKQQYVMYFTGNGCTDSDYHIADNVAHFASLPPQFPLDYQSYSLLTVGIDNVTAVNNVLDTDFLFYGGIRNITKESSANGLAPATIQRLNRFGNRNLSGMPIPDLADDVHAWGGDQTLASGGGFPLSGKIYFADESDRANGIITGTGTDFLTELRLGDLLGTNSSGGLGRADGPFYVQTITSATKAALSRAGHPADVLVAAPVKFAVKRYRGQVGYLPLPAPPFPMGPLRSRTGRQTSTLMNCL